MLRRGISRAFILASIFVILLPIFPTAMALQRIFGKSALSRQVPFAEAWNAAAKSDGKAAPRFCCLIYATQNGWKLPILFEEMGMEYDWCLVDFEINQQKSPEFLKINPNGRIPALIDREKKVTVAESGAILEYICDKTGSKLLPSKEENLQLHLNCKQWVSEDRSVVPTGVFL